MPGEATAPAMLSTGSLALGARAGARLARKLGLLASSATLLHELLDYLHTREQLAARLATKSLKSAISRGALIMQGATNEVAKVRRPCQQSRLETRTRCASFGFALLLDTLKKRRDLFCVRQLLTDVAGDGLSDLVRRHSDR